MPDKVILWLAEEQFPDKEGSLPKCLSALKKKGLTIKWCKDMRSYKKLLPALGQYPGSVIVTADDDVLYPKNWLALLLNAYVQQPNMIHCHRAHKMRFKYEQLLPYLKWYRAVKDVEPSYTNFLTGVGGVLYPPYCLHKDVLNVKKARRICPTNDDIWFWAMAVLNKTKINVVENNIMKFREIPGTQGTDSLCQQNNGPKNLNDVQLKRIMKKYPGILDVIFNRLEIKHKVYRKIRCKLFGFIPLLSIENK